jgi:monothiol glutaredoxin
MASFKSLSFLSRRSLVFKAQLPPISTFGRVQLRYISTKFSPKYVFPTLLAPNNKFSLPFSQRRFSSDSHDDFKPIFKQYNSSDQIRAEVRKFIDETISSAPVVIFMKGTPEAPRCGFSGLAVAILREEGVTELKSVDVLEDVNVRQGIKDYTNWQTIPQIFINREFIGGADILKEMFATGELTKVLQNAGVKLEKAEKPEEQAEKFVQPQTSKQSKIK